MTSQTKKTFVKLTSIIVSLIFLLAIVGLVLLDLKGRRNNKNAQQVSIGMHLTQLKKTMGEPDNISIHENYFLQNKDLMSMYFYRPPLFASEGIVFAVDQDSIVRHIEHFEGYTSDSKNPKKQ